MALSTGWNGSDSTECAKALRRLLGLASACADGAGCAGGSAVASAASSFSAAGSAALLLDHASGKRAIIRVA